MRDESPRVGRPRKGTQRKPKERGERYRPPVSQNSYAFSSEEDFHISSDTRHSKQAVSPINLLTSPTSMSSVALSHDSASPELNQFEENDNGIGSQEAVCAFCNCGSEMAQILGQISRYYQSSDFDPFKFEEMLGAGNSRDSSADKLNNSRDSSEAGQPSDILLKPEKRSVGRPPGKRKKRGRQPVVRQHLLSVDMCTFGTPFRPELSDVFDADGCIWAHHCCAAWSAGVCQTDSYDLENVDKAAYKAIGEQCSHCNRHGASTECQVQKCTKLYHYPCCASAGAFQDIKSMILLCPDHLDHAARLAGSEAYCVLCNKAGDISKQLFCTSCGRHYHGQCLDPPVSVSAIVRMGWQCPECKVCQGCRQPGDDEKMLFCDECDKGFHTYCLSPPMSSVPKTAWKCYSCRKCEDCGSNVPGNGPSCRWHFNYTVCDKCYQQRKKGTMPCCPMCGKAVRSSSGEFSRQCVKCCKLVHCRCDKFMSPDVGDYFCPICRQDENDEDSEMSSFMDPKEESNDSIMLSPVHSSTTDLDAEFLGQRTVTIAEAEAISRTATGFLQREPSPLLKQNEIEDLDLKGIDINFDEVMMETELHGPLMQDLDDLKPDSSDSMNSPSHISSSVSYLSHLPSREEKQITRITAAPGKAGRGKKKMPPIRCRGRPPGSAGRGKKNKSHRGGRPRSKTASTSGSNKENIQAGVVNSIDTSRKDDSDDPEGLHSTVVMVSTKDRFTLEQDICMCCGSFGKGSEGHLIACAQCGQCFHPYCVNVKISKVVMTKGWRCLDCTVCEGCGKNEDEGKLLLCDGCDISYHIYCLDPPLDEVPSDGWKCQWCVECVNCGATSPGVGCKWMSGYTQCGPCASDISCPICNKTYLDDELVVKCMHCTRWLHADCDGLASEDDAELAASYTYHCIHCREKTGHYGIFSTSWTNIVERGIYTSNDGKISGLQSVIVTQTTTTVMATGIANRRSKGLSNSKSNRNPLTTSGWNQRQPQEPVKASAEGTFDVQLPGLKVKGRKEDNLESDNVVLTDDGLRQIKSLVVKASSRSHNRSKDKPAKLASIDDRANERETKTSGQLTETSACSEDIGENRQPVCLPVDSKEASSYDGGFAPGSYQNKERQGSGRPSVDKRSDTMRNKKPVDKSDNAMDFFGPTLLKVSKKKRKKETATGNETQSSEDESSKADKFSGNNPSNKSYTDIDMNKPHQTEKMIPAAAGHAGSWQSGMKVDQLTEEMQHQDSIYKTLNMLVTGTEDTESRNIHRERELAQQKSHQSFPSSNMSTAIRHPSKSNLPDQNSSMGQGSDMAQTGDLDLIGLADLPHVDGHEVEEIFAGIEREMSVEGTPQSHGQSPMDTSAIEYQKAGTGDFGKDQPRQVDSPGAFQAQNRIGVVPQPRPESVLPAGYPEHPQQPRMGIPRQEFTQYDVYSNNQSFPIEQNLNYKAVQRPLQPQPGETDAFKAVFGEEPEIKSKAREGTASPKIDGQKQLKKWEQDEKLDSLATISPVLYANIVHPELKIEYPEWPNRARAIARLWRKLPQGQREPFRLRARDNRVKQKDQGRKLGPFKKATTSAPFDGTSHFYDSSSKLSSEMHGSSGLTSTHTETSTNSIFSQIPINGEQVTQIPTSSHTYSEAVQPSLSDDEDIYSRKTSKGADKRDMTHLSHSAMKGSEVMLQTTTSALPLANVLSPNSQFSVPQNSPGSFSRAPSRGSSKPPSFSDLTAHDVEFSGLAATPTTPVFASSPFPNPSLAASSITSPGVVSPTISMEVAVGEKRKLKKANKSSKDQTDMEKEEKKRRLALEQEKERQWKLLQQQRLREQQSHQQTSTIQQVMMMKEQMRKDNNKSGLKSQQMFVSEQGQAVNELRLGVLPHVEPLALTQSAASKDTQIVNQILETLPADQPAKQRSMGPSNTVTTPSNNASHPDYHKNDVQQSTHSSTSQAGFPGNDLAARESGGTPPFGFDSGRSQQNTELDSLLQINDSDLIKMANTRSLHNDVATSTVVVNNMPTVFVSKALTQLQMSTDGKSEGGAAKETVSFVNESGTTSPVVQKQIMTVAFSGQPNAASGQQVIFSSESSNASTQAAGSSENQVTKALSGFILDSHPSIAQTGASDGFDKQPNSGLGPQQQQQQQQALLFQQQQFMAAQQQYIQWQLQQRNPELFQSMTTPIHLSSYTDKDLPEVDSEEQHQERIRFLYRQRQMQKQQVVQMQQQLHQQQVYTPQQVVQGSTTRPQMDQTQHYFVQQLMQYQQQIPEALQQQFLIEYSRQMQQRGDVSQNALQYDKFLAELAQRYGYPMQQSNAPTVSVMQHGVTWPNSSTGAFHSNLQQIFAYSGIDEEKAKELTPQQLYQLQMQQTLMMQMAASGLYPAQAAALRNQSPAGAGSRKGSTSATQSKKSRDNKKTATQDKAAKAEASIKSPLSEDKVTESKDDGQASHQVGTEILAKSDVESQNANVLPHTDGSLNTPTTQEDSNAQSATSSTLSDHDSTLPPSDLSTSIVNNVEKSEKQQVIIKESGLNKNEMKSENHDSFGSDFQSLKQTSTSSPITISKDLPVSTTVRPDCIVVNTTSDAPSKENSVVCTDGIHCGTDSESEDTPISSDAVNSMPNIKANKQMKTKDDGSDSLNLKGSVCSDGIHCGTDSEDEDGTLEMTKKDGKAPCTDGIHCGTDSEEEEGPTAIKKPCTDGIHCGTDSEEEAEMTKTKQVCVDGIHCGTDSEDEGNGDEHSSSKDNVYIDKKAFRALKSVCSDGVHCGTDSEEEDEKESKSAEGRQTKNELIPSHSSASKPAIQPRPLVVVCRQDSTVSVSQTLTTSAASSLSQPTKTAGITPISVSNQTLEVIQEGDVTQTTFNALENMNRNLNEPQQDKKPGEASCVPSSSLIKSEMSVSAHRFPDIASHALGAANEVNSSQKTGNNGKPLSVQGASLQSISAVTTQFTSTSNEPITQSATVDAPMGQMLSPKGIPKAPTSVTPGIRANTSAVTISQGAEPKLLPSAQANPFSPKAVAQVQQIENQGSQKQKSKVVGIPPTSPQYQQLFMHQHQLLIMQFQQYQYQLQVQYQQLSQQQMSPQQQFLLQQQYHQQMMLLQRQFVQQQAHLQSMASTGMQFTEQELNIMYQQQMVAQQAYKQWVATLSLDQQGQLHARMQANMQQVQQGMAAMMQNILKTSAENSRDKPKKQRGRRSRKSKSDNADAAVIEPSTPTQPQTPASFSDTGQPATPNKDVEFDARRKGPTTAIPLMQPSSQTVNQTTFALHRVAASGQVQNASGIAHDQAIQAGLETGQPTSAVQRQITTYPAVVSQDQGKPMTQTDNAMQARQGYSTVVVSRDQRLLTVNRPDWPAAQPVIQPQQPKTSSQIATQPNLQPPNSQTPRVDIVPEGSNPFSDVYQEMEKKTRVPGKLPNTPIEQPSHPVHPNQTQPHDNWKNLPNRSEQVTPRPVQQQMQSSSAFYYPSTSTSIHNVPDNINLNQVRRATPVLPQNPSLASPTLSQSHSVAFSLQGTHYNSQTPLVTLSTTTVIDHSSHLSSVNSAETHLAPSNLQQHHWMQTTSVISQHVSTASNIIPHQHQVTGTEHQKTTSIMYPPQNGGGNSQGLAYPPQLQDTMVIATEGQSQHPATRSPSQYPPSYSQLPQPLAAVPQTDPNNVNFPVSSEPSLKENAKVVQKRQRSSHSSHVSSGNVDFSLLSPEEQRKFILERKREDFERRRRLLEEQRHIGNQVNQKGLTKKADKKVPKTKQQRKLKGAREKEPIEKSPVQTLLVLEDKTFKLPLCEPEVHLLYPLVQPFGSGYINGDKLLFGAFGNATLQGEFDYYSQFPSPNPPVTSSNPPTPPSSLPPSPGTINQSLRDSLQMIPTEGIFDDVPAKTDIARTSHSYEQKASMNDNVQKDSKDGVLVTLTMSANDRRIPNDRVSYVTDMLGVAKPETIQVIDESTDQQASEKSVDRPQATSIGRERDVHYSCLDSKRLRDSDDNKEPFCRHCDISIHGTGYVECKIDNTENTNPSTITIDNVSYEKVNITPGTQLSNAFCSQLCLTSYYSLSKSKMASERLSHQEAFADDSGQFIDPVRSVIPVSTGEASNSDYFGSNIEGYEVRGDLQASSQSSGLIKRKMLDGENELDKKRPRPVIWKRWKIVFTSKRMRKDSTKLTIAELLEKYGCMLKPDQDTADTRECMLCGDFGDGVTEGTARLINYDVNLWVHLNCALWSLEVYETLNGALHNVQKAYERGIQTTCVYCQKKGATVTCARVIGAQMRRCEMNYHFNCAIKANCVFFKDKTVLCPQHKNYGSVDQRLPSYAVYRKVYVNRDITKQLARVLRLNNEKERREFTVRIGSLIFHELGQLLPHQLQKFHSKDAIYPVGFKTTRLYWSSDKIGKRCSYLCSVEELDGNPRFVVSIHDCGKKVGEFAGGTPKDVWSCIFEPLRKLREDAKLVKIFPEFVTGEDLYGLSDPSIQRIIESLPGVDTIHDYSFRFGRTPIIMSELPLAVNPTGCIRSESTRNVHLNRPVSLRTASSAPAERVERGESVFDDISQGSLLRNSWAISKTAQYRRMKSEWKNYLLLSKSRIQGLGLFAVRDIEPNTMIIEYIGSLIRNEVANKRERIYENSNRGVYMFRVDSDTVIDATMTGGPARYINHSCDPNCVAEVVIIEKMPKIIIISNRKLEKGEELTYDYKFEFEDDQHKIACLCGAANCRKWMN